MKPYLTEKSVYLASVAKPVFTLAVAEHTSADEIRRYLKDTYQVDMTGVRFLTIVGENIKRKGVKGYKSGIRKALVSLKKGQTVPEFAAALKPEEKK